VSGTLGRVQDDWRADLPLLRDVVENSADCVYVLGVFDRAGLFSSASWGKLKMLRNRCGFGPARGVAPSEACGH
jgi:hypothetical protein